MNEAIDINCIKVSAIITTYNRYPALMKAIESVKQQTHSNIEIIVVNDKSESEQYYDKVCDDINITWIDLEKSSREVLGFPSSGYVRNIGIAEAKGDYIAFLDDDDFWMPDKICIQLSAMVNEGWIMSCTEGYMGDSLYDERKKYPVYHAEYFQQYCDKFFKEHYGHWDGTLPNVFDLQLIEKHNFIITSSVMLKKSMLDEVGLFKETPLWDYSGTGTEDWDLWKRILEYRNCLNINQPLVYYDGHLSRNKFLRRALRKIGTLVASFAKSSSQ